MKPPTLDPRDVLPTIHCAPEICRSCREWIVLQFDLREKAGREKALTLFHDESGAQLSLDAMLTAARLAGRREALQEAATICRTEGKAALLRLADHDRLRKEAERDA